MKDNLNVSDENGLRLLRYQMQAVAKHILPPQNRVKICLRCQIAKYGDVDVYKHRQTQKSFYGGLMLCGSVWVCPLCASKISERRRSELRTVFDRHRAAGGYCTMLTLTFSHCKTDKLSEMLKKLGEATQGFRRGRPSQRLKKEVGEIGNVRCFEITYGQNGWHPHIHLLLLHTNEINPWERSSYESEYFALWNAACWKVGLMTSAAHGLKLDDAAEADEYIGKWGDLVKRRWGVDREMTKANIKKGRVDSITPFDMLRQVVEDGDLDLYSNQYREYAAAVKGKQQLVWSKGLKKKYGIEEKSDEEIVTEKEERADLLGQLDWKQWRKILEMDKREELLSLVEKHGYDTALNILGLKKKEAAVGTSNSHFGESRGPDSLYL